MSDEVQEGCMLSPQQDVSVAKLDTRNVKWGASRCSALARSRPGIEPGSCHRWETLWRACRSASARLTGFRSYS